MKFFEFLSRPETQQALLRSFSARYHFDPEKTRRCSEYVSSGGFSQDIIACRDGSYVFCIPERSTLNRGGKVRIIYKTEERERLMLALFSDCLYGYFNPFPADVLSRRTGIDQKGLSGAVMKRQRSDFGCYLSADIRSFSDNVCPEICLASLRSIYPEDTELIAFFERLMQQRDYYIHGVLYHDGHALKQGCQMIGFLAELCLLSIDKAIISAGIPYLRYVDDLLLFLRDKQEAELWKDKLNTMLSEKKLCLHEEKTAIYDLETPFSFLRMDICGKNYCFPRDFINTIMGTVRDYAIQVQKTSRTEKVPGKLGMWFFLSSVNKYLYGRPGKNDGTAYDLFRCQVSREHLQRIDRYVQDQARIIGSGKRNSARYRITYEELKRYGYRSLVNEYYKWRDHK